MPRSERFFYYLFGLDDAWEMSCCTGGLDTQEANEFTNMTIFHRVSFRKCSVYLATKMNHPAVIRESNRIAGCTFFQHFFNC